MSQSQLGSVDEKAKKPLPLSATTKKKLPPPSSFMAQVRVLSLLAALAFAFSYGGLAAYNFSGSSCHPARFLPCYRLTGAAAVGEAGALERRVMWCSAPQAAAAALALLMMTGRRRGGRALALVALAAAAANHWMYSRLLGLARAGAPRDLFLAVETVGLFLAVGLDLLGFVAFVLGGDE